MYDITIIGGGIIGLATSNALLKLNPNLKILILDKESKVGQHQTGHNSGVIHSGIYYKPNSLKAINCRYGRNLLINFCDQHDIKYEMCGKVIIATSIEECASINMLYDRGKQNGIEGMKKLKHDELREYEPHANGISALYCPETGIIDYAQVCEQLALNVRENGEIALGAAVIGIIEKQDCITVITKNAEYETNYLINCAGLFSDFIAELAGINRQVRIVPFRGEYYMLKKQASSLVKNLIYPVPDPRYPFLGVHFTRTIHGDIESGPNAVLAWAREGYKKTDFNLKEVWDYFSYRGFWRMAGKYWTTAIGEYYRSFFKAAFVKELQRLVPELNADDIIQSPAGVRAQALAPNGSLVDDFVITNVRNMIHVVNAPSPAATSSLAIGEHIANIYIQKE